MPVGMFSDTTASSESPSRCLTRPRSELPCAATFRSARVAAVAPISTRKAGCAVALDERCPTCGFMPLRPQLARITVCELLGGTRCNHHGDRSRINDGDQGRRLAYGKAPQDRVTARSTAV